MNALEKARMAKEAERKEREAKRGQNGLFILGIVLVLVSIAFIVYSVIITINQAKGLGTYDNDALNLLKSSFYIAIGGLVGGLILFAINSVAGLNMDKKSNEEYYSVSRYTAKCRGIYYELEKKSLVHFIPACLNALGAATHLVMIIIVLFSGKLGVIEYYSQDGDGIIYAQTKNDFKVIGYTEGAKEITIRGEVNDYFMDSIGTNTFKKNNDAKVLTFADGDIDISKKAFKGWKNLETINFGDYTYSLGSFVFEDSSRLKEFNVGSAEITIAQEYSGESSTVYDKTFSGITNATITVDGGKLHYLCDSVNMYKIGNNSEVIITNTYEDASFKNNSGHAVNKKVVLLDGFTFDNSILTNQFDMKIIGAEFHYYPFAYTMYIPTSVTSIPEGFFGDKLFQYTEVKVHYAGSEHEWNNISIESSGNGNYSEGKVKVTFNSPYSE